MKNHPSPTEACYSLNLRYLYFFYEFPFGIHQLTNGNFVYNISLDDGIIFHYRLDDGFIITINGIEGSIDWVW